MWRRRWHRQLARIGREHHEHLVGEHRGGGRHHVLEERARDRAQLALVHDDPVVVGVGGEVGGHVAPERGEAPPEGVGREHSATGVGGRVEQVTDLAPGRVVPGERHPGLRPVRRSASRGRSARLGQAAAHAVRGVVGGELLGAPEGVGRGGVVTEREPAEAEQRPGPLAEHALVVGRAGGDDGVVVEAHEPVERFDRVARPTGGEREPGRRQFERRVLRHPVAGFAHEHLELVVDHAVREQVVDEVDVKDHVLRERAVARDGPSRFPASTSPRRVDRRPRPRRRGRGGRSRTGGRDDGRARRGATARHARACRRGRPRSRSGGS